MISCKLDTLPPEIFRTVLGYLDVRSASRLTGVNRRLQREVDVNEVWRSRMAEDFPQKFLASYIYLSDELSFLRLYAVEKKIKDYQNKSLDVALQEMNPICLESLRIQVLLTPVFIGLWPAACGLAITGSAAAVAFVVDMGLLNGRCCSTARAIWNRYVLDTQIQDDL